MSLGTSCPAVYYCKSVMEVSLEHLKAAQDQPEALVYNILPDMFACTHHAMIVFFVNASQGIYFVSKQVRQVPFRSTEKLTECRSASSNKRG